ncbi:hypothetical protein NKH36_33950 [Mesorhizobium sp. M1312]|uniref:hypothetical protein n=1 Tax=unclassified Mesorhizobium TaxID=325217 RepID=UPI0033371DC1
MPWPNRTSHVLTQVWLVRRDTIGRNGMLRRRCAGSGRLGVARALVLGTFTSPFFMYAVPGAARTRRRSRR